MAVLMRDDDEPVMECGHSFDELTTMGTEMVCRVCVMQPLVKDVLKKVRRMKNDTDENT